jgi:hypothetical protein
VPGCFIRCCERTRSAPAAAETPATQIRSLIWRSRAASGKITTTWVWLPRSGLWHAGGVHDAWAGFAARVKPSTCSGACRRYPSLRSVLRLGLCVHVRMELASSARVRLTAQLGTFCKMPSDLRRYWRRVPRRLDLPVRVCRHLLTITSGAMIGRNGWIGDLLHSFGVPASSTQSSATGPGDQMASRPRWPEGNFLPSIGTSFHDFAGSTVVHTIGGFTALAGWIVLGPSDSVASSLRDGGGPMLPHV